MACFQHLAYAALAALIAALLWQRVQHGDIEGVFFMLTQWLHCCMMKADSYLLSFELPSWTPPNVISSPDYYRGKKVIVTGASKGIGRSLAIQLARLGAK